MKISAKSSITLKHAQLWGRSSMIIIKMKKYFKYITSKIDRNILDTCPPTQTIPLAILKAWEFYLKKTQEVVDKYKPVHILKTDANNEAEGHPRAGGIVENIKGEVVFKQIEYSQDVISRALTKYPLLNIDKGDIRQLPYLDNQFDMVLDLSTIDHVRTKDVQVALNEYIRVVKNSGLLLLVVWCANRKEDVSVVEEWDATTQYWFWYDDIRNYLQTSCSILEEEDIIKTDETWTTQQKSEDNKWILKYILVRVNKRV